jgi:uncharacterized membrane protein YfcA
LTTPVGVSGAVLLLPVQLSVLGMPSPAVSPTNLLYNVISVPGALLRFRREGRAWLPLARLLLVGSVPGAALGATLRVVLLPDGTVFRGLVAVLLLVLGSWILSQSRRRFSAPALRLTDRGITALGLVAGFVGGIYGIGGGSLLAPVLVLAGIGVATVAPAALLSTFVTSCAGVVTFAVLAASGHPEATPSWALGVTVGLGGLIGGYIGASLQPRVPQRALRIGLGVLLMVVGLTYAGSLVWR